MELAVLSSGLLRQFTGAGLVAVSGLLCSQPLAQPYMFRCFGADGTVEFTDRICHSDKAAEPLAMPSDPGAAERKAQNDARLQRDKALTLQYETARQAEVEALRASQARQLQIAAGIAARLASERNTRNAAAVSILPPTVCDLCKTPGSDAGPAYAR